jgi:transposase
MARPLSLDLRKRIVRAVEGGLSRRAAAARFAVSESCAIKLVQRWKRTGSVAPATLGAPRGRPLRTMTDWFVSW